MIPLQSQYMPPTFDIGVYGQDGRLVLVVEVKAGTGISLDSAAGLRTNLLAHGLLSDAPYFLLASPRNLLLWKSETPANGPADFMASADPVLRDYLPTRTGQGGTFRSESLQLAMLSWLGDLASAVRTPDLSSEPDRMIVDSGLYDAIHFGEVKSEVPA
jgi:hypothetical protein